MADDADAVDPHDLVKEEDWGELDAWLAGEGRPRVENREDADEREDPPRKSWQAESSGRMHDHFFSNTFATWPELGATPRLEANLAALGVERPSTIQKVAFKPMIDGDDCLIAASCGTGKTWGYLAPLIQQLWQWEAEEGKTPKGQVRAIIIVPNAELGQQVLEQARDLASGSIRASIATGEQKWSTQSERMQGGLELLVATMGRLVAHLSPRDMDPSFSLEGTRTVIVEEADALYAGALPGSTTYYPKVEDEGQRRRRVVQEAPLANWKWLRSELPEKCATALVTCVVPEDVYQRILEDIPGLKMHVGKGIHMTRPGVVTRLVDCSQPIWDDQLGRYSLFEAKLDELLRSMEPSEAFPVAARQTVVLCNTAASCERLSKELRVELKTHAKAVAAAAAGPRETRTSGVPNVSTLHASLTPERRRKTLEAFRRPDKQGAFARPDAPRILVATGRAARGLELAAGPGRLVEHVVLFDFPPDGKAYISRIGCATRGDAPPARVTALAVGPQLSFAKAMLEHDREGSAVILD